MTLMDATGTVTGDLESERTVALRRAWAGWLAGHRSPNTREAYARAVKAWTTWAESAGVDPYEPQRFEAAAWVTWQLEIEHAAPDSVRQRVSAVRGWHNELSLCALRENRDPWYGIKLPHAAPIAAAHLSVDDVKRLLDAARWSTRCPAETAIAAMATMGLRASEIGNVTGTELQQTPWGPCLLIIGKGARKALVPAPPIVLRAADRVGWPAQKVAHQPGWTVNQGRRRVYRWVAEVAKRAGVKAHPHQLRHFFVTTALEAGVDLHRVQRSARHADPKQTIAYDRLRQDISGHATFAVAPLLEDEQ